MASRIGTKSGPTTSTLASASLTMNSTSGAARRQLTSTHTALARAAPKNTSKCSMPFLSRNAMRSWAPTPAAASPAATRLARSYSSPHDIERSPSTSDTAVGALRRRACAGCPRCCWSPWAGSYCNSSRSGCWSHVRPDPDRDDRVSDRRACGCCAAGARARPARAPPAAGARTSRSAPGSPCATRTSRRPGCRPTDPRPRRCRPWPASARRPRRAAPSHRPRCNMAWRSSMHRSR